MSGGGQQVGGAVAAAAAAEGEQALAGLTWVKPWDCAWPGCGAYLEDGTSQKSIDSHMAHHRKTRAEAQEKRARRDADRAHKVLAAGAGSKRKENRAKDMTSNQRAEAKKTTKGNAKGDGGRGRTKAG